jgi:hypothetical protein
VHVSEVIKCHEKFEPGQAQVSGRYLEINKNLSYENNSNLITIVVNLKTLHNLVYRIL